VLENREVKKIPLDLILEPRNAMRSYIDDEIFCRLKESIKEKGVINPILVRKMGNMYEIVTGHRRYLACKSLGMSEIPAVIIEADDKTADILKAHENFTQEQVNPLDKALWVLHLIERHDLTVEECAKLSGLSETSIRNSLLVLQGNEQVLQALRENKINFQQAIELNRMPDKSRIPYFLEITLKSGATASQIRQWRIEEENRIRAEKEVPPEEIEKTYNPQLDQRLKMTCPICFKQVLPQDTMSIHLCFDCYIQFKEQLKQRLEEAKNKDDSLKDTGQDQGSES